MITEKKIYHANVNVNFLEENIIQIKSRITINVDVGGKEHHVQGKDYIWNPARCSCKNGKYLTSILDDSVMTCDEIRDADAEGKSYDKETKSIPKNIICETKSF